MIFVDELKDFKVYSKPFYLPINEKNRKIGSAIYLLTPNYQSSINLLNSPFIINNNTFQSYYMEKNVNYFLMQEGVFDLVGDTYIHKVDDYIPQKNRDTINEASAPRGVATANSASALIKNNQGKYLVIYSNTMELFTLPGGKCEDGESKEDALKRELKEEIGITPIEYKRIYDTNVIGNYIHSKSNPSQVYFYDTTYRVTKFDSYIRNMEPDKCKGFKWLSIKEIMNIPIKMKSGTLMRFENLVKIGAIPEDYAGYLKEFKNHNVCYYGSDRDINDVRQIINTSSIKQTMLELGYKSNDMMIDVNIIDDISFFRPCNQTSLWVYNRKLFNDEFIGDYELYLKSEMYTFILNKYNPNLNKVFLYTIPRYLSGEYEVEIEKDCIDKQYSSLFDTTIYIDSKYGRKELLDIIKKNDMKKFIKYGIELDANSRSILSHIFNDSAIITEAKKDHSTNMQQLIRRNKMKARRGSVYKMNSIDRFISKVVDPNENMPDIKDSDGNILNQTSAPDTRSASGNSSIQNKQQNVDNNNQVENNVKDIQTERFDEFLNDNDYLVTTENLKMISEEAVQKNSILKSLLYGDRIKKNKEILDIYDKVKEGYPKIKFTYVDLKRYNKKNLFIDLSYYNEVYFRNSKYEKLKGFKLYSNLLSKLLSADRFTQAGYTKKSIFIPIRDWDLNRETKMWIYSEDINPISIIFEGIKNQPTLVKNLFKDMDIVFFGEGRYFKINFSHYTEKELQKQYQLFKRRIDTFRDKTTTFITPEEDDSANEESKKAIVMNITDKLEKSQGIKIMSLGLTGEKKVIEIDNKDKKSEPLPNVEKSKESEVIEKKKEELMDAINKAAELSNTTDDALEQLDNDRIKQLIIDLASEEEEGVKINQARASRMLKLQNDFVDKELNGIKIKDLLEEKEIPITPTNLNIGSANEEWDNLTFINFDKEYNINGAILSMINSLNNFSYPLAVRDIQVEDTSTSQDIIDTYTVKLEDSQGNRYTIKFDMPIFIENKYMLLRGSKKMLNIQLFLMPIIKTTEDTCQIISNYNKIFVRRSTNIPGKANAETDKLIKALNKYDGDKIDVRLGDNSVVCKRYELPIDYIDLATLYSTIETKNYILYFNQTELREKVKVDLSQGIPIGINKKNNSVLYYNTQALSMCNIADYIVSILMGEDIAFAEIYNTTKAAVRHCYSEASMLGHKIPLIVIMAYSEGLIKSMNKAGVKYELMEKLDKNHKGYGYSHIKFNDGYVVYESNYATDLLMDGLKVCYTEGYSLSDINKKSMYVDFLDNFGGRLLADGLDCFYDCMLDPITKKSLEHYHLPTDYIEVLAHANILLTDNKFTTHIDINNSRRFRRKEILAAKLYRVLCTSYESYVQQIKHNRNNAKFSMKQSAVIDAIMAETTFSDKSFVNVVSDVEDNCTVSAKGHSGMNSEGAYTIDKRGYDPSMINVLSGMGTGFSGNVGMTRQATIDANVDGVMGYVKSSKTATKEMNDAKSLTMTEAIVPFGLTHDEPIRSAMTFIQTAKHAVTTEKSDPILVTNGADEAIAYYSSNTFAFKAAESGKVLEVYDNFMIIQYKSGRKDMVPLGTHIEKNSNGGYSVAFNNVTDYKVGKTFKENDILAYDESSFTRNIGENDNLAYNNGKLVKIAIINTDKGFEDSAAVTEQVCEDLTTRITMPKLVTIHKSTNVYNMIQKGTPVEEGDSLIIIQSPSDEDDINLLMKNLTDDEEKISELGRIPIHSHYTGIIKDIKIYRTCDVDEEMSDSLRKIVNKYEGEINKQKKILASHGIKDYNLPSTGKLPANGKLKNAEDSVVIEFDIEYEDRYGIGDKLVYYSGNKGVNKYIIPKGLEPTSTFRPDEKMGSFVSISSINGRMITSTILIASLNKLMIELDRSCKDMAGIPYDVNDL